MTYKNLTNTEYMREYREKNKEKIKAKTNEYVKKYYKMNNEKVKTYSNARYRMGAEFVTFCRMFDKLNEKSDKCFCVFVKTRYESCGCSSCENWGGCNNPIGKQYYQCKMCNKEKIERQEEKLEFTYKN